MGITSLLDDSIVLTGWFYDEAIFGKGEPNEIILTSGKEKGSGFIACYNSNGTLQWAKRIGGRGEIIGSAITNLSDDSFVVTGVCGSIAIFGEGEQRETILTSEKTDNIFVAYYNVDGTLVWAKQVIGGPILEGGGTFTGPKVAALSDNSIGITGWFQGTATFGPGEPNETIMTSAGECNMFIAIYNPNGMLKWAKHVSTPFLVISSGITGLIDNSLVPILIK